MKIIKPYGRSHVETSTSDRRRVIRLRDTPSMPRALSEFAGTHDELVIAQWISMIDKIATKPTGVGKDATEEQHGLRKQLGEAAWALIETKKLLTGLEDSEKRKNLQALWDCKIAPYGNKTLKPRDRTRAPSPKGRWYRRFAGDHAVDEIDPQAIAENIYEHLYDTEYRLDPARPGKRLGRIAARAESIAGNILRPDRSSHANAVWTDDDWGAYARAGDVAAAVREAARRREAGEDDARTRRVGNDVAGAVLYRHYGKCSLTTPARRSPSRKREAGIRVFSPCTRRSGTPMPAS